MKNDYIPASEAFAYPDAPRIRWAAEFEEYVPTQSIGVNLTRLNTLARVAGITNLSVTSKPGDVTRESPDISGVDAQGTALASMRRIIDPAKLYGTEVQKPQTSDEIINHEYKEWSAQLFLNTAEMSDQLNSRQKLRDSKAWSAAINHALQGGIRTIAKQNLVTNIPLVYKSGYGIMYPFTYAAIKVNEIAGDAPVTVHTHLSKETVSVGLAWLFNNFFISAAFSENEITKPFKGRRWTVISPNLQLDRLAMAHVMSRTRKLSKKI